MMIWFIGSLMNQIIMRNMHNSTWDCEYYINDDKCDMLKNGHLDCALASLKGKGILSLKRKNGKDYYSFVW